MSANNGQNIVNKPPIFPHIKSTQNKSGFALLNSITDNIETFKNGSNSTIINYFNNSSKPIITLKDIKIENALYNLKNVEDLNNSNANNEDKIHDSNLNKKQPLYTMCSKTNSRNAKNYLDTKDSYNNYFSINSNKAKSNKSENTLLGSNCINKELNCNKECEKLSTDTLLSYNSLEFKEKSLDIISLSSCKKKKLNHSLSLTNKSSYKKNTIECFNILKNLIKSIENINNNNIKNINIYNLKKFEENFFIAKNYLDLFMVKNNIDIANLKNNNFNSQQITNNYVNNYCSSISVNYSSNKKKTIIYNCKSTATKKDIFDYNAFSSNYKGLSTKMNYILNNYNLENICKKKVVNINNNELKYNLKKKKNNFIYSTDKKIKNNHGKLNSSNNLNNSYDNNVYEIIDLAELYKRDLEKLKEDYSNIISINKELESKVEENLFLDIEREKFQNENFILKTTISDLKEKNENNKYELLESIRRCKELDDELYRTKQNYSFIKNALSFSEKEKLNLKKKFNELNQKNKTLDKDISYHKRINSKLSENIKSLTEKLDIIKEDKNEIEDELELIRTKNEEINIKLENVLHIQNNCNNEIILDKIYSSNSFSSPMHYNKPIDCNTIYNLIINLFKANNSNVNILADMITDNVKIDTLNLAFLKYLFLTSIKTDLLADLLISLKLSENFNIHKKLCQILSLFPYKENSNLNITSNIKNNINLFNYTNKQINNFYYKDEYTNGNELFKSKTLNKFNYKSFNIKKYKINGIKKSDKKKTDKRVHEQSFKITNIKYNISKSKIYCNKLKFVNEQENNDLHSFELNKQNKYNTLNDILCCNNYNNKSLSYSKNKFYNKKKLIEKAILNTDLKKKFKDLNSNLLNISNKKEEVKKALVFKDYEDNNTNTLKLKNTDNVLNQTSVQNMDSINIFNNNSMLSNSCLLSKSSFQFLTPINNNISINIKGINYKSWKYVLEYIEMSKIFLHIKKKSSNLVNNCNENFLINNNTINKSIKGLDNLYSKCINNFQCKIMINITILYF